MPAGLPRDSLALGNSHSGPGETRRIAVAELLALSPATVLDWFEAGKLPGFRLGGRKGGPVRFRESEVAQAVESWRVGERHAYVGARP